MGNCFGTGKNNNKIGPEPVNKKIPKVKDASEILSNATPFRKPSPCEEKAMIQDLAKKGGVLIILLLVIFFYILTESMMVEWTEMSNQRNLIVLY